MLPWVVAGAALVALLLLGRALVLRAFESRRERQAQALASAYEREVKAEAEKHKAAIDRRVEERAAKIDKMNAKDLEREFND